MTPASAAAHLTVLHLIPSFAGGGAERQLAYLATAQALAGHEIHVGHVHGGPNLTRLIDTPVRTHRLSATSNYDPRLVVAIVRLIRTVRPSIVQTWLTQMDVFGGAAARICGVPWVLSERASAEAYGRGWKDRLRVLVARRATAVVANSGIGLQYWDQLPRCVLRETIRNIVPVDSILAAPQLARGSDGFSPGSGELILAAGRLEPQKNWLTLLRAFDAVLRERPAARAVIFGDGFQRAELLAQLSRLEYSERIHIRTYTPDLWGWLKRASVYVSVSLFEGTPNIVLEAVACGCSIVVSDIPSHREILPADAATYVAARSVTSIADGIVRALRFSPPTMSANAKRALLEDWTAEKIASEYNSVYERAIRMRLKKTHDAAGSVSAGKEPH